MPPKKGQGGPKGKGRAPRAEGRCPPPAAEDGGQGEGMPWTAILARLEALERGSAQPAPGRTKEPPPKRPRDKALRPVGGANAAAITSILARLDALEAGPNGAAARVPRAEAGPALSSHAAPGPQPMHGPSADNIVDGEISPAGAVGKGSAGRGTPSAMGDWRTESERAISLSVAPSTLASYQGAGRDLASFRKSRGYTQEWPIPVKHLMEFCVEGKRRGLSVRTIRGCWERLEQVSILLCGHSMIFWAGRRAVKSRIGTQLGLSQWASVRWLGRRGMRWDGLLPTLFQSAVDQAVPQLLVIHLGGRDKQLSLLFQSEANLKAVFPLIATTHLSNCFP
ncbi:uncharacterized protein LOC133387832 isoform X3 [Rhineura floridana]|uniref:uncharacterized protein LOC133387832 isoform X3 n=1 Tax=Rhineura floridana TaxID=261503 RepID=UPI002AC8148C|nr:uncharacterized protein LOC133387832 isoform X3 [Rhineura floridana]